MKLQKTQIAAAVGAALLLGAAAAQAQDRFTVQAYGQVSRALLWADDGTQNKWFHVDNEASGTRFGFTGTAQAMPGLRGGFRIELDLQSNESQLVTFGPAGPVSNFPGTTAGTGFNERHMDAWLEGAWGRVNMGQGDGAANGGTESDLSGTGMANGIGVADLGGGFQYRNAGTTPASLSGTTVGQSINQQDFESRYDRLLYVTPTFSGFRAQASWGQSGNADVKEASVWYAGKVGGDLTAAIGWSQQGAVAPNLSKDVVMGGSVSWLHTSGFNLTYSYSQRDQPNTVPGGLVRTSDYNYFKVGFKRGAHAFGVDYALGNDFAATGDEASMMGVGYVWNPIRWLELYGAYKIHSLDRTNVNLDDVTIATVGTRIRF